VEPDVVLVVGDVNSTRAAALTAVKLGLRVAHVEAGLRSFDRSMPEEINRIVTDAVSDLLFVTEESGRQNLIREGVAAGRVHVVGNVMIDALEMFRPRWERSGVVDRLGLRGPYAVLTLHRPANVDEPMKLVPLLAALAEIGRRLPVIFPVHPRVRGRLREASAGDGPMHVLAGRGAGPGVVPVDPLGYLDFIALLNGARLVLTDSGGIQEETTFLGIPCLTLRDNTERPVTVSHGTNRVIGSDPASILREAHRSLDAVPRPRTIPPLWDGCAAVRIVEILVNVLATSRGSAR
jgi:UDP-N-acetylglucosamine 2-epimerase (non-hydrolysing)